MHPSARPAAHLVATLLIACARSQAPDVQSTNRLISAHPTLHLTSDQLPEGHEFSGIYSARRQADGTILVANSGAWEIEVFDSTGHYVRSVGRKGAGPGEFLNALSIIGAPGDSIAIFDSGNARWTIWDSSLKLGRTIGMTATFPHPVWLHKGAVVTQAAIGEAPAWVLSTLDTLRARDAVLEHLIEACLDDTGALWVRDSTSSTRWNTYTTAGPLAAHPDVPAHLRVFQIGKNFILAGSADSLGLESVELYPLDPLPGAPTSGAAESAPSHGQSDSSLVALLPKLLMAQEMFYSGHGAYTSAPDSLSASIESSVKLFILSGDKRHWAGVVVRRGSYATCAISVGSPAPAGWLDGTPICEH
jgi:hypothetical protein